MREWFVKQTRYMLRRGDRRFTLIVVFYQRNKLGIYGENICLKK